jgi:hypothetical protein
MAVLPEVFEAAAHAAMSNYDLALDLARQGVHVFPCQPDGEHEKKPCSGVFWRTASTCNETRIRQWWDRWPEALPGIDLAKAGLVVIDCDRKPNRPDGVAAFAALSRGHPDLTAPVVETANGGLHYYFRQWAQHGNGTGSMPPGIDVRGHGGYVIAPGATFLDGRRYEPVEGSFLDATECPAWIVEILQGSKPLRETATARYEPGPPVSDERKRMYGETALDAEIGELASAAPGTRNETANRIAFRIGQLVGGGCLTEREAYAALHNAATSWGIPAKDKALGPRGTIMRGLRAGTREPRGPPEDIADNVGAGIVAGLMRRVVTQDDGTMTDAETGEVIEPTKVDAGEDYPDERLHVDGLIGDIADWIMKTSMFPCRLFATAAALSIVGVAVARQVYTGVPRTGTSLYWLAIAPTAGGKERPQEAIRQVLAAAGLARLAKPSYASAAKLGMSLTEAPAQIQIIDEVGKVLRRFVSRNASSQELGLLDDYCTIWGKNTGSWSPEGVTVRSDVMIQRPALSFFGATTPAGFYEQLRAKQVAGGFLNRFLVCQRFKRVPANEAIVPDDDVPQHIVEAVRALNTFQDGTAFPMPSTAAADMSDMPPALFVVPASPSGQAALEEYRAKAWQMILKADEDPILEVYARSAEMVKRMALILACGRHWQDIRRCEITPADVDFAAGLVDWSMATFVEGLRENMAENDHQASVKEVVALVRRAGSIKRMHLIKKLDGKMDARTLDSVIKMAIESGDMEELVQESGPKGGRPSRTYIYAGDKQN